MKKNFQPTTPPLPPVNPPRHAADKPSRQALLRDLERCSGDASDCVGCQLERTPRCKQRLLRMTAEMLDVPYLPRGVTFLFSPKCASCRCAKIAINESGLSYIASGAVQKIETETVITCEYASLCDELEARFKGEGKD